MDAGAVTPDLARGVLESSLALKAGERLVVVTDTPTLPIGQALFEGGLQAGAVAVLTVIAPTGRNGAEPPPAAAAAMLGADVLVCPTRFSLSHTQARLRATEAGARVATMPGVHAGMFFDGPITADHAEVARRTLALQRLLTAAQHVLVRSGSGSELRFSIQGREGRASTGRLVTPGAFGNLPSGEAYLAPLEGTAEGELVVNASVAGIGRLESPMRLVIRSGELVEADGAAGGRLLELLGERPGARNLAEFGIGTNERARITGVILEDEKAIGTIHIAFGDNSTFGGTVRAGVHIDTVIQGPDVFLDDVQILGGGQLLV
ncbi:MAG TPA: aminopeptidase [Candidatus Dormibacteraeota bacterium]|nr:aminopeptidase [Candidatus Dormibacteraeota bacterium]